MAFTIAYDIKAIDKFSDVAAKVRQSMDKLEGSVKKVQKTNEKAIKSFKHMGDAAQRESKKMSSSVEKSTRKIKDRNKALKDGISTLKTVGGGMEQFGSAMMTRVVAPMAAAGGFSVKAAMDINKGMATVATLIPGNVKRVNELKNEIQSLAQETGTSTADLTEGVYAAISAWGDSTDTMERMRTVTMASKAGLASTSDTMALLSTMSEIYGDNSANAVEHISDLAFVTNTLAIKAPFGEMASSMGRMAPLAKQLGITMEDLFATMTAQAGVTGSVSEVSTQMASLYGSVIKQTPAMKDAVMEINKELKTNFKSASDAMEGLGTLGFSQMLTKVTKNSEGLSAALGGRKEGFVLALSLVNSRAEKYNEALKVMQTESGATKVAFEEVANGINKSGHSWDKTKAKMMVMAQRIGDRLLPMFDRILTKVTPVIEKIANFSDKTISIGMKIAGGAAGVGAIFLIAGKIATLVASIGSAKLALAALTGPIGLAIAGFAALAAGVALCWDELKPVRDMLKNEFALILGNVSSASNTAAFNFGNMAAMIKKVVGVLAPAWAWFGKIYVRLVTLPLRTTIWQFKKVAIVVGNLAKIIRVLSYWAGIAKNKLTGFWDSVKDWFSAKADDIPWLSKVRFYLHRIASLSDKVFKGISKVKSAFTDLPANASGLIASLFESTGPQKGKMGAGAMGMSGNTLAASAQNVNIQVDLNAPEGTVEKVKTKSKGGLANVNVGKQDRAKK
jgi:TP901 family phage tail tape measure protein